MVDNFCRLEVDMKFPPCPIDPYLIHSPHAASRFLQLSHDIYEIETKQSTDGASCACYSTDGATLFDR